MTQMQLQFDEEESRGQVVEDGVVLGTFVQCDFPCRRGVIYPAAEMKRAIEAYAEKNGQLC